MKLTKKKIAVIAASCLCSILLISGGGILYNKSLYKSKVFFIDNDKVSVVSSKGDIKELLEGEEIAEVNYYKNINRYLAVNTDDTMFMINKSGVVRKMADDVVYKTIKTPDNSRVYFIGTDNKLYFKKEIGTKQQVKKEDIADYFILNELERLHKDMDDTLYYYKYGDNTYEIKKNVSDFKVSPEKKNIALKSEGTLYFGAVSDTQIMPADDSSNIGEYEFLTEDSVIYLKESGESKDTGSLNYKSLGTQNTEISSDVTKFIINSKNKTVYYIDSSKNLYKWSSDKGNTEIQENVKDVLETEDGDIYCVNENNELYEVKTNGKVKKTADDVINYKAGKSKILYKNSADELFSGKKKLGENVKSFQVSKGDAAYITEDGNLYMVKEGAGRKKCLGPADSYKEISMDGKVLSREPFNVEELKGAWKAQNQYTGFKEYYKFSENNEVSYMDFNNYGFKDTFTFDKSSENSAELNIHGKKVDFELLDNGQIKAVYEDGTEKYFDKITEEDYEDAEYIISRVSKAAKEINPEAEFEKAVLVNNLEYYLYTGTDNIYLNNYGETFEYNEENDSMVPKVVTSA